MIVWPPLHYFVVRQLNAASLLYFGWNFFSETRVWSFGYAPTTHLGVILLEPGATWPPVDPRNSRDYFRRELKFKWWSEQTVWNKSQKYFSTISGLDAVILGNRKVKLIELSNLPRDRMRKLFGLHFGLTMFDLARRVNLVGELLSELKSIANDKSPNFSAIILYSQAHLDVIHNIHYLETCAYRFERNGSGGSLQKSGCFNSKLHSEAALASALQK